MKHPCRWVSIRAEFEAAFRFYLPVSSSFLSCSSALTFFLNSSSSIFPFDSNTLENRRRGSIMKALNPRPEFLTETPHLREFDSRKIKMVINGDLLPDMNLSVFRVPSFQGMSRGKSGGPPSWRAPAQEAKGNYEGLFARRPSPIPAYPLSREGQEPGGPRR